MRPEDAPAAARAAAQEARERGAYADDLAGFEVAPTERVPMDRLLEWAMAEPDLQAVRSTRRHGAPITFVKRLLARALRQYLAEQQAQQARFNVHLVVRLAELEERLERLERRP